MKEETELFFPRRIFTSILPPYTDLETAKVVILPVPYDSTTEWRSGARDGPRAIIDASQYLELYDLELGREIYEVGIHTLPEVRPLMNSPEAMIHRVYLIAKGLIAQDKLVVMLGGEHSLSLGTVRAFRESCEDLCVLQLDAHADLRHEYLGTNYSHACVMRRVSELCPIIQVGVRSLSWEEQQFLSQSKMQPFYMSMLTSNQASSDQIISLLTKDVYVTIDLDVFDPSVMPAVGTPEPGGMQWYEVLSLLSSVAQRRHIVGFDIMELCPNEGPVSCAFLAAKLAYKLIGYSTLQEMKWKAG